MPRRRLAVAMALFITVVINYLDRTNLSIAAIDMAKDLHFDKVEMGLVFSAFAWSYSLCQIPGGILADKLRPRTLYPLLLALWSLATIVQGYAGSIIALIACRFAIGLFEAPSYPINNRVVTSWFPTHERAGAIGFYTSGQFLGLAILAPVLVFIQAQFGWRELFFACGAAGLIWAIVWWAFYRDSDKDTSIDESAREALRQGGAVVDWSRRAITASPDPGGGAFADVFANSRLWGIYLGQYCIGTVTIFFLTWFPTYLVENRGIAFAKVGWTASLPYLAGLCGVLLAGLASDALVRRGFTISVSRKGPVLLGMLLSASMILALYVRSDSAAIAIMSLAFFGNGMASITWIFVSLLAPPHRIGMVGGVFNFIGGLSAVITPIVVGLLVKGHDFSLGLIYVSVVALIGLGAYLFLVGKIGPDPAPARKANVG